MQQVYDLLIPGISKKYRPLIKDSGFYPGCFELYDLLPCQGGMHMLSQIVDKLQRLKAVKPVHHMLSEHLL
jgi:hypothetical protein